MGEEKERRGRLWVLGVGGRRGGGGGGEVLHVEVGGWVGGGGEGEGGLLLDEGEEGLSFLGGVGGWIGGWIRGWVIEFWGGWVG